MNLEVIYRRDLDESIHLYNEGKNYESYEFLGVHKYEHDGKVYASFTVWAPNARDVFLVGDFNQWHDHNLRMENINNSGIWNICISQFREYDNYKYRIISQDYREIYKADPYAYHSEFRPNTSSKVYDLDGYEWQDQEYMKNRLKKDHKHSPMSIYEVHLGSWMRHLDNNYYSFSDMAKVLPDYVKDMGYTHVEFMPMTEFPFDGSWGYQVTGYFAVTSRYGTPKDFMYLIDEFHKRGIGVILDWVPVHFTRDAHGLSCFDGWAVYEKPDPYRASVEGWGTLYFDFYKPQVKNFLISSALFFMKNFHVDGLRVDAVSALLYLTYGGKNLVNEYGGQENLEAIEFVKELNSVVKLFHSDVLMIAEESTAFPKITEDISKGGLGFDYKWNMGWMHDILDYFELNPIERQHNHDKLTFTITYAFSENYVLPFSHDEVVHEKGSMLNKMNGYYDDKFKALMSLYAYMYAHPGKKLMFMGSEIGTFEEWNHDKELAWSVLNYDRHKYLKDYIRDLNKLYKSEKAFYEVDDSHAGYEWIDVHNNAENIIAFERIDKDGQKVQCFFNFSPVYRDGYRFGVWEEGKYDILLNSSHKKYGGDEDDYQLNSVDIEWQGRPRSVVVNLKPYQILFIKSNKK